MYFIFFSLDYMNLHPDQWMHDNIEDCCNRFFYWDLVSCLGSDPNYADPTTSLYYPDWIGSNKCINDGNAPGMCNIMYDATLSCYYIIMTSFSQLLPIIYHWTAYMKNGYTVWMHDSLTGCCARYYTWEDDYNECIIGGGGTVESSNSSSENMWYAKYSTLSCAKNCEGATSCSGIASKWDILYSSKEQCCHNRFWWMEDSCVSN